MIFVKLRLTDAFGNKMSSLKRQKSKIVVLYYYSNKQMSMRKKQLINRHF